MKDLKRRVASLERHLVRLLSRVEDMEAFTLVYLHDDSPGEEE